MQPAKLDRKASELVAKLLRNEPETTLTMLWRRADLVYGTNECEIIDKAAHMLNVRSAAIRKECEALFDQVDMLVVYENVGSYIKEDSIDYWAVVKGHILSVIER
jgi:hypothetical protein